MINTYQTSLAPPPPVPPRHGRPDPVLIPTMLPSQGHSKALIKFLVGVTLLHLFLSIGGFIYLNYNRKMGKNVSPEEKASYFSSEKQETSYKPLARMVVEEGEHISTQKPSPGYLQWDIKHSVRREINYFHKSWLTILQSGDYFVYSRVTFSKGDSERPLTTMIKLRKSESDKENTVMQAFCNLDIRNASVPRLCTASQGEVITLEKGNQLSVWVQDLLLVNYEETATTFGIYKL